MKDMTSLQQKLLHYVLSKAITLHQEGERHKLFGAAVDDTEQIIPIGLSPDNAISPHLLFSNRIEFHLQEYLEKSTYLMGAIGEDVEIYIKDSKGNLNEQEGLLIKLISSREVIQKRYLFKKTEKKIYLEEFI